jgi:hypothetical protein
MRTGISVNLSIADRDFLEALVRDRNTAQKHAWRAEIVLLSADGVGTNKIMRQNYRHFDAYLLPRGKVVEVAAEMAINVEPNAALGIRLLVPPVCTRAGVSARQS